MPNSTAKFILQYCPNPPKRFLWQAPKQVDNRMYPSYVDGIVASLGTKVKTGTGMARKTPVQLNDGSWVSARGHSFLSALAFAGTV